jgi:hypothetical protein
MLIIKQLRRNISINHFDRVWRREKYLGKIISTKHDFDKFFPYNDRIWKGISEIKKSLKRLPIDSARTGWALNEIEQTKERLEGLANFDLKIRNKVTNGKLLSVFSYYVRRLRETGKYDTISFLEFWEHITSEDLRTFYNANEMALKHGAKITRIYVVNEDNIKDEQFLKKQIPIISTHTELTEKHKNYKFKILFLDTENYYQYLLDYKNFAIWESRNEIIIFKPEYSYSSNQINFFPENTRLLYIDMDDAKHNNFHENIEVYKTSQIEFETVSRQQETQPEFSADKMEFLRLCKALNIKNNR